MPEKAAPPIAEPVDPKLLGGDRVRVDRVPDADLAGLRQAELLRELALEHGPARARVEDEGKRTLSVDRHVDDGPAFLHPEGDGDLGCRELDAVGRALGMGAGIRLRGEAQGEARQSEHEQRLADGHGSSLAVETPRCTGGFGLLPLESRRGARDRPRRDGRRGARSRLRLRIHRRAAEAAAAGRIPAGGRRGRALHAGVRGGRGPGEPARRDRRDPPHVRRGASLFRGRPARGTKDRPARRGGPDRRGDGARRSGRALLGLVVGRGPGVRALPLGREHRRPPARARGTGARRFRQRQDRRRLADRRGPGDGPDAGPPPGARASARRAAAGGRRGHRRDDRADAGQGGGVRRRHALRRPPRGSEDPGTGGPHGVARALHAGRAGRRARHRGRRRLALRRVVRARRVLRRGRDQRIGPEPSRGGRRAAAPGRLRGALLRLGRDAVRPGRARPAPAAGAARGAHHPRRQVRRRVRDRAGVPPPLSARR